MRKVTRISARTSCSFCVTTLGAREQRAATEAATCIAIVIA